MKYKVILLLIIVLFFSCKSSKNDDEITINKNEYHKIMDELVKLRDNNRKLSEEINTLKERIIQQTKRYQIVKGYNEIIEYEEDYENRAVEFNLIEDTPTDFLFDYYGNGTYLFGLATLEGYYTKVLRKGWEEEDTIIECDGFVITDGPHSYISSIKKLLYSGNTVYDITEEGKVITVIELEQFNEEIINKIRNSTNKNKVLIEVFIRQPTKRHATINFTFVKLHNVL
ncbi:hypothetical protein [Breznakiella homolactica]|uniref:Uncharacterized protein n=1 Tax=Breznakiella homolactica TaxID=2798577 RepID=A0A7T7XQ06_9SPIR|nr:hypothetical protein [Breznakiella homolactica]QQO10376.1 hypothetical protein JFL75_05510 [Breznakiella homolactica]